MPGPLLWGPNNTSNNLQNQILNPAGSLLAYNGPKNYISNSSFENQLTTGWSLGTTGTLTNAIPTGSPSFGSGASGNLSVAIETSGQIAGLASLGYISSAATTAGNMLASDAFTIDIEDQASVLNFSIAYKAVTNPGNANWSGTSSNSFGVAIYDVTNSAYIIPVGVFNFIQSTGVGKATGIFQTSSNGTSYRIIVYNANATSGAVTLYFDDIVVGPSVVSSINGVVDFNGTNASIAVTANVTNVSTTIVKDSTASWNSSNNNFVVPIAGDYVVSFAGISTANTAIQVYINGSANNFIGGITSSQASGGCILIPNRVPGDTIAIRSNTSVTLSNVNISIFLLQNSQTSPGANGVVATNYTDTSGGSIPTSSTLYKFQTKTFDTTNSYSSSTGLYTVPISGVYNVTVMMSTAAVTLATNQQFQVSIFKNGSIYAKNRSEGTGATNSFACVGSSLVTCNAGDTLQINVNSDTSTTANTSEPGSNQLSIFLVSTSQNAVNNASINARYFASATSISGSLATVVWTTKDFDSNAGMSSGVYTIPVTGKYQVNTALAVAGTIALNSTLDLQLQKNGTAVSEQNVFAGGVETGLVGNISDILNCVAGDTIRLQVSTSITGPSIVSSNSKNFFSISRAGN